MSDRKEYIERGALIKKLNDKSINAQTVFINTVLKGLLYQAPVADVVEVVRCGECKFYETVEYWHPDCNGIKQVCRLLKRQMQEDDFCSYGERKGGAE